MKQEPKNYRVLLLAENVGNNKLAVFHILARFLNPSHYSAPLWRNSLSFIEECEQCELTGEPVCDWRVVNPERLEDMKTKLEAVGAKLIFYPYPLEFIFPSDQLSDFDNRWYSQMLLSLEETRLTDWAEAQQASEVYRLTVLPTFSAPYTFRIWTALESRMVKIIGAGMAGYDPQFRSDTEEWILTNGEWSDILEIINSNKFWTSASWDTMPEYGDMRDGTMLVFEGFKAENYKVLIDQCFYDDGPISQLEKFLSELNPANLEF